MGTFYHNLEGSYSFAIRKSLRILRIQPLCEHRGYLRLFYICQTFYDNALARILKQDVFQLMLLIIAQSHCFPTPAKGFCVNEFSFHFFNIYDFIVQGNHNESFTRLRCGYSGVFLLP